MIRKILVAALLFIACSFVIAQELQQPTIRVSLNQDSYSEGSLINGVIELGIRGLFSSSTVLKGEIGNASTRRKLADAFDESEIEYEMTQGSLAPSEPTNAKTFSFAYDGKNNFYLKLPKGSDIDNFEVDIKGLENAGSFPLYPSLDIGDDGRKEWKFAGALVNFGNFILPNGLQEQNEAGVVYVMNREDYFCEVVNLSEAKDFEVHAKYAYGDNLNGANLTAAILSYSGSGNSIQAQGGANSCAMPEATNDLGYHGCNVRFTNSIKGTYLACVYNKNQGNGNARQYLLAKDNAPGSGYRCNRIQNGQTNCEGQVADFFVKAKAGNYDRHLRRQANIEEGRTEYVLKNELKSYLATCMLVDSVNCLVPVSVESGSAGILYFDNMRARYRSRGSQFIENFFYDASGSSGYFTKINGNSLSNATNMTITMPISVLGLVAPSVSQDRNISMSIGLEPGSAVQKPVKITKAYSGANASVKESVDSHKTIISGILERHGALFDALGTKETISDAIDELEKLSGRARTTANSNKSASEKANEETVIMNTASSLIRTLPRGVVVLKSVSDVITPSYDDVSLDILLPEQRTDEGRQKVYGAQESITVNAKADYTEVTYFNDNKDTGTLVTKQVSGAYGGYFVEIIPDSVANINEVKFGSEPEILSQSPLVARFSSSDGKVSYFVGKDLTSKLAMMPTVFVPETLPDEEPSEPIGVCGDGECTAIKVGDEIVWLEDKHSCPADCKPKYPWSVVIVALLLIAAIVFYINFYHGKYSFQQTIGKGGAEKQIKTPFSSRRDEEGVKEYITNSLSKGFNKQNIVDALRAKGWTKEQIEHTFKQLKK